jgi:hypothetical protein
MLPRSDDLQRRPPGARLLVYLDQSTLSSLVRDDAAEPAREALQHEVDAGRLLCPSALGHRAETWRSSDRELAKEIDALSDQLSIGIGFRALDDIEWEEIYAAAREFCGGPSSQPLWREAFDKDPHTPREELFSRLFGGDIRIRAFIEPSDLEVDEVDYDRSIEERMEEVYRETREAGRTYDEVALANLEAMLNWKLGPVLDPDGFQRLYVAQIRETEADAEDLLASPELSARAGSPPRRLMASAMRLSQVKRLIERYPAIAARPSEFRNFAPLRSMPSLAYPALLRAALAVTPGRRARPSDWHDVEHLTVGLSRCDIVTADRSMVARVEEQQLAPTDCELIRAHEFTSLLDAIQRRLEQAEG